MDEWRMNRKIGNLSEKDLRKFMELIVEFMTDTIHDFSLVAVSNPEEKILQVYDERWKCWLFPYFRSTDSNKENVDRNISDLLKMNVTTEYVAHAKHCKYSISDDRYKIYNHKLYKLLLTDIPESMRDDAFEIDGIKYSWMSFEELEVDLNTMQKNDDIIAFVKSKI